MYSYGKQSLSDEDIQAVVETLRSDWLTQGPKISEFEAALCEYTHAHYCTAVSNGTAALHLAGLALGWRPGDVVLTSPLTFAASANCILYCGATPEFVDIDPQSYTIDPFKLEDTLQQKKQQGQSVKAVVAVDFAGHPCDWDALRQLANQYEFQLVDDAAHALGATFKDSPIGSNQYADITMLSFHPVKHITTGEGGALLCNDAGLDKKLKSLRQHGIEKDASTQEIGPWFYEMRSLGFNYRITDLQCALGISQLSKIEAFLEKRRHLASCYQKAFQNESRIQIPFVEPHVQHAYHLYPVKINFLTQEQKKAFFLMLQKQEVFPQVHYIPVHLHPYYQEHFGFQHGDFPEAEAFYQQEVSLPMHPGLNQKDIEVIADSVIRCMDECLQ